MSIARVIGINEHTAGILVPETPGRFGFFSSNRLFDRLEGRFFLPASRGGLPLRGARLPGASAEGDHGGRDEVIANTVLPERRAAAG
jgi:hypothetical protein